MEAYRQCSVCGAAYGKQPVLHPLRQSCGHTVCARCFFRASETEGGRAGTPPPLLPLPPPRTCGLCLAKVRGAAPVDLLCYSLLTTSAASAATGFGGGGTVLGEPLLEHVDDATRAFLRPVDSRGILRFLTWLPEGHRAAVMAKGPLEGCRNPSAVLNHRMERAFGGSLVPPLAHYAHDNQLGRDCVQFLQTLRPEVLREVVLRGGVLSCASPLSVLQQRAGVVVDARAAAVVDDAATFLRGSAAPTDAAPSGEVRQPPAVLTGIAAPPLLQPRRALPPPPPPATVCLLEVKKEEGVAAEPATGERRSERLREAAASPTSPPQQQQTAACGDLFSQDLLGRDAQVWKPPSVVRQPPPPQPQQQQPSPSPPPTCGMSLTPPLACFAGSGAAATAARAAEPSVAAVKQEEGGEKRDAGKEEEELPAAKRRREMPSASSLASAEMPLFLSPPTLLKPRTRPAGIRDTLPLQRF